MKRHLLLSCLLAGLWAACAPQAPLPIVRTVESVELVTSRGTLLTSEEMTGSPWVVNFIFTSCRMACPLMTERMHRLYDDSPDAVRFLSVSTDPDVDTVERLHEYAGALAVDEERWVFGRAALEEARRLSEKEFLLGAEMFPAGHSQRFVLLDANRRIRGYYDSAAPEELAKLRSDLDEILP